MCGCVGVCIHENVCKRKIKKNQVPNVTKIEKKKSAFDMVKHVSTYVDTLSSTFFFKFRGIKNEMVCAHKFLCSRLSFPIKWMRDGENMKLRIAKMRTVKLTEIQSHETKKNDTKTNIFRERQQKYGLITQESTKITN